MGKSFRNVFSGPKNSCLSSAGRRDGNNDTKIFQQQLTQPDGHRGHLRNYFVKSGMGLMLYTGAVVRRTSPQLKIK